ncbi:MAG TPA: hypothetical protein VGM47_10455 [Gammaproteobacteria bacterium]
MALLPVRSADKPARVIAYLPTCIAMMAPSIIVAVLDRRYGQALAILVVAAVMLIVFGILSTRWRDKPAVEVVDDVLTIRMPAKRERILLPNLRQVVITGPRRNRDWIFRFRDGSTKSFRPHFPRSMDECLAAILREVKAGRFEVTIEAPLFLEL